VLTSQQLHSGFSVNFDFICHFEFTLSGLTSCFGQLTTVLRWNSKKTELEAVEEAEKFLSKKIMKDWWANHQEQDDLFHNDDPYSEWKGSV
jgi:hypothetical protein